MTAGDTTHQDPTPTGATLFVALYIPGIDTTRDDPDSVIDDLVALLNAFRDDDKQITVSAIPAAQWLTAQTLENLRRAARGES